MASKGDGPSGLNVRELVALLLEGEPLPPLDPPLLPLPPLLPVGRVGLGVGPRGATVRCCWCRALPLRAASVPKASSNKTAVRANCRACSGQRLSVVLCASSYHFRYDLLLTS